MSPAPSPPQIDCNDTVPNNASPSTTTAMASTNDSQQFRQNSHTSTTVYPSPCNTPSTCTSHSATTPTTTPSNNIATPYPSSSHPVTTPTSTVANPSSPSIALLSSNVPSRSVAPAQSKTPFICHHEDCGRFFQRKTALTNHLKAHMNVRSRSIKRTRRQRERQRAAAEAIRAQAVVDRQAPGNANRNVNSVLNGNRCESQGMTNADFSALHFPNGWQQEKGLSGPSQMHGVIGITTNVGQANGINVNMPDHVTLSANNIQYAPGNSKANRINSGDVNDHVSNFNSNQQPQQCTTQYQQLATNPEFLIQRLQLLLQHQHQQHQLQQHFAYQAHIQRQQQLNQEAVLSFSTQQQQQEHIPANFNICGPETKCVHRKIVPVTPYIDDGSSFSASASMDMAGHRPGSIYAPTSYMHPEGRPQEQQQQNEQVTSYPVGENVAVNNSYMKETYQSSSCTPNILKMQSPVYLNGVTDGFSEAHPHAQLLQAHVQERRNIQTANQMQHWVSTQAQQDVKQSDVHAAAGAQVSPHMGMPGDVIQVRKTQSNTNTTYPVTYIPTPDPTPPASPSLIVHKNSQGHVLSVSGQASMHTPVPLAEAAQAPNFVADVEPNIEQEPDGYQPEEEEEVDVSNGDAKQKELVADAVTSAPPIIHQTEMTEELGLAASVSSAELMIKSTLDSVTTHAERAMNAGTITATENGNMATDGGATDVSQLDPHHHYLRAMGSGSSIGDIGLSRFMSGDSNGTYRDLGMPIPTSMQAAISGVELATGSEAESGAMGLNMVVGEEEGVCAAETAAGSGSGPGPVDQLIAMESNDRM